MIIDLTKGYLDPTSLFQVEVMQGHFIIIQSMIDDLKTQYAQVEEALDKLKVSLRTLKEFKSTFQKYKGKLPEYFEGKEKSRNWEFQVINQSFQLPT